jgi:release factor glutamine methyltransferase
MRTVRSELEFWKETLASRYDDREIQQLFRLAIEDLFGWPASTLLTHAHEALSADAQQELDRVLERLKSGEPYQYIVGFAYFDDLKIGVSPAVLIPRPETEELVNWVHETLKAQPKAQIIDWCSGSGCIALALKHRNADYSVVGSDVSEQAINQARMNAKDLGIDVRFYLDDALKPQLTGSYDVVVSNPPYIPIQEKTEMAKHVIEHEPDLALFVPDHDALLFYRKLAEWALVHLKSGGSLFFELHENYARATKQLLESMGFLEVEIRLDLQGKERMLRCVNK